jgi:serine/threonine-protein kinase
MMQAWRRQFSTLQHDPDVGKKAGTYPAAGVSWDTAERFAQQHQGFLPTEAQWEFAARSCGRPDANPWDWDSRLQGQSRDDIANIGTAERRTPDRQLLALEPVGTRPSDKTRQGLLDMGGNVREWCRDAFGRYTREAQVEPFARAAAPGQPRVLRGFSIAAAPDADVTTYRQPGPAAKPESDWGFRIVVECPEYEQTSVN